MSGPFGYISQPTAKNGATMHELANQAAESASIAKATITPAPKGKLTGKWKAYVILTLLWFIAAATSLFLDSDGFAFKVAYAFAYTSVATLALWVLRPPVQYKEATK